MTVVCHCHRCRSPVPSKDAHRRGTMRFCTEQCAEKHLEDVAARKRAANRKRKLEYRRQKSVQPVVLKLAPVVPEPEPEPAGPPDGHWLTWPLSWRVLAIQTHGARILGT